MTLVCDLGLQGLLHVAECVIIISIQTVSYHVSETFLPYVNWCENRILFVTLKTSYYLIFQLLAQQEGTFHYLTTAMRIPERERRRLAELAQRPVDVHTGTPYPCHQFDIDLCRHTRQANHNRLHRMEATHQLTKFNRITKELTPAEQLAYRNIQHALQLPDWGPDLLIKAFKDLDRLFFMGRLHGRTLLGWSDPAACIARTGSYRDHFAVTLAARPGTVKIVLNIHNIMFNTPNPYTCMFTTLLHECWWLVFLAGQSGSSYDRRPQCIASGFADRRSIQSTLSRIITLSTHT